MEERTYVYHSVDDIVASINQLHYTQEKGKVWRQYVIAAVVNIGIACTGYSLGWTSPVHGLLSNVTTSPLDYAVRPDQEAWMGSLLAIGAIFGPFIAGLAVSHIGPKWGLINCTIPLFIGWILILTPSNVGMIYAGRVISGLGVGMVFTISPMYCAEIATDDSRGALGSYVQLFSSIGLLIVYSLGPFASYNFIGCAGIAFVTLFGVGMFFMPESPMYYLIINDRESATACLMKLRGRSHKAVASEIDKMNEEVRISMARTASLSEIFSGNNFKAMYISSALFFFQQFSGVDAMLFYLSTIFEAAGVSLDTSVSTIIVGFVLVVASCITPFVVDRAGRRILLLISTSGTAIAQGMLGMYFLLAEYKMPIVSHLGNLPVISLMLFILAFSVGMGPLPFAIMSELLPIEVKNIVSPIATTFCWLLLFLITRFFSSVAGAVGMGATFLIFAMSCVGGFFFSYFVVPETKGKSFQEIQEILASKSFSPPEKT